MRHAVAIGKNKVTARGRGNGFVKDDGFAETIVRMPNMFYRHRRTGGKFLDQFAGCLARTVVRDDNFFRLMGLPPQTGQPFRQIIRLIESADDQRDARSRFHCGKGG